jgi:acyl-CoA thioester hydrolase
MSGIFEKTFHIGWANIDFNGHMGNTSYLDLAVDVRMFFFKENGFPVSEFQRRRIGPVIFRDEIDYFREFFLLDEIRITFQLAAASDDASRFRLRNEFFDSEGRLSARLNTTGSWLDLERRKLTAPPEDLKAAMETLRKTDDFETLSAGK